MAENTKHRTRRAGYRARLDIQFETNKLPSIFTAFRITSEATTFPTPLELSRGKCNSNLGEGLFRAVVMESVRRHGGRDECVRSGTASKFAVGPSDSGRGMTSRQAGGITRPMGNRPVIIRFTAPLSDAGKHPTTL